MKPIGYENLSEYKAFTFLYIHIPKYIKVNVAINEIIPLTLFFHYFTLFNLKHSL